MNEVLDIENLKRALERVKRNKGAPGIDGMTVDELGAHLKANWLSIRAQLVAGSYCPKPVRRVEIPKPDGRTRLLGIPTVTDRFIQQAEPVHKQSLRTVCDWRRAGASGTGAPCKGWPKSSNATRSLISIQTAMAFGPGAMHTKRCATPKPRSDKDTAG